MADDANEREGVVSKCNIAVIGRNLVALNGVYAPIEVPVANLSKRPLDKIIRLLESEAMDRDETWKGTEQ